MIRMIKWKVMDKPITKILLEVFMAIEEDNFDGQKLKLEELKKEMKRPSYKILGEMGLIEILVRLIDKRILKNNFDEIMNLAWKNLRCVTDCCAENCELFIKAKGLQAIKSCIQQLTTDKEIVFSALILIENISEFEKYRIDIFKESELIAVVFNNFKKENNRASINFIIAWFLAQMISNGEAQWKVIKPTFQEVNDSVLSYYNYQDLITKASENTVANIYWMLLIPINIPTIEPIFNLVKSNNLSSQLFGLGSLLILIKANRMYKRKLLDDEETSVTIAIIASDSTANSMLNKIAKLIIENLKN